MYICSVSEHQWIVYFHLKFQSQFVAIRMMEDGKRGSAYSIKKKNVFAEPTEILVKHMRQPNPDTHHWNLSAFWWNALQLLKHIWKTMFII